MKIFNKNVKIAVHRLGHFFLKPVWNMLPELDFYSQLRPAIFLNKICNANCIFCNYQFLRPEERQSMSEEVFEKVVEGIKLSGIKSAHFTSTAGEPLLTKGLLAKIKALRQAGARKVELTTNAIILDTYGIERFLEEGPDIINISTTAFDQQMYKRIYRSDQYERMRKNVIDLLNANRKRSKPRFITIGIRPDISVKECLSMPQTQELMALADSVEISRGYGSWLGLINQSMLSGEMKIEKARRLANRPCQVLMSDPAIQPNGDIIACSCRNIKNDPRMYLGNILKIDLKSALEKIRDIAKDWKRSNFPETCFKCTMYGDPAYYWPAYFRTMFRKGKN